MMRGVRACLAVIALSSVLMMTGHAGAGSLETLMADLARVEERQARFVEERTLGILDETLITEGTLTYQAPDRLIRQDLLPEPALYAVDGDTLTIVVDGHERVVALDQEPALQALITPFRALFAGDLAALKSLFDPAYQEDGKRWTVTLAPNAGSPSGRFLDRIEITGEGQTVKRMDVIEQGGDRSSMRLDPAVR
jgi:outer membrane lipoprotein-sorting protein